MKLPLEEWKENLLAKAIWDPNWSSTAVSDRLGMPLPSFSLEYNLDTWSVAGDASGSYKNHRLEE